MFPWRTLELIHTLITFPADWQADMGDQFPAFKTLCLQPHPHEPRSYPCPRNCGCWHRIIRRHDGAGAVAACECEPPSCPDLDLTIEQITPLELNRAKLGRALCQALLLNSKPAELPQPYTNQIGSWSAAAVPVILTIQTDTFAFQSVVADLVAQAGSPFILLAPTSKHVTAHVHSLLARVHAGFFPLESIVTLTSAGTLLPVRPPGELFARFTPQPKEMDEDTAARVVALVNQFDAQTLAVFRHYCIEGRSAAQVAIQCHSSKTAVMRRLKIIRDKTGIAPAEMRRLSPHLAKIEDASADPRAAHIHRKRLIYDETEGTDTGG